MSAFLGGLQDVLAADAPGVDKARVLRAAAEVIERTGAPPQLRIVPFVPGHRPIAEATAPGLGSSEDVALILPGSEQDRAHVLYDVGEGLDVRARLSFTGPDGSLAPVAVPGWEERAAPELRIGARHVLPIDLADDLLAGPYRFTFDHLFSQRVLVEMWAMHDGVAVASSDMSLLVCDLRRTGSLYARLLDRLVAPDTERQAEKAGVANPGVAYHPWFPVLEIGSDKAALYTRALIHDIAGSGEHLSDPGWLMRVGLYLEFLTFLGICEAVRADVGDLLSPGERAAFESEPWFEPIRASIDPDAWRTVWELRRIQFGAPRTGAVSARNLLAKKKTTLRFLHVHHEDLKHAIRLAGPNHHNAQETWQRVFRDAERAVLRNVAAAFPELESVSKPARDFVLWHRKGRWELGRTVRLPGVISALFADQDGLYGSACTQYRDSMNDVADWAKERGLMDHTGEECIPRQVSLLEAHVNQPVRVALLQHHDGYGPELEVGAELPAKYQRPAAEIEALLAGIPILALLAADEQRALARTARPLTLGPTERLVVQGEAGGSLFVIADGELEVMLRGDDGEDVLVDTMSKGAVVGEMSLLTGEPRSATVRSRDGSVVYEVGVQQYAPILRDHPELVDILATLMVSRLDERRTRLDARATARERAAIARRIRRALTTAGPTRNVSRR